MNRITTFAAALSVGAMFQAGTAFAANMCKTDTLSCSTAMPVGGYCECHAKGATEGGTVLSKSAPHPKPNSTAGGCGAHPGAPGCR